MGITGLNIEQKGDGVEKLRLICHTNYSFYHFYQTYHYAFVTQPTKINSKSQRRDQPTKITKIVIKNSCYIELIHQWSETNIVVIKSSAAVDIMWNRREDNEIILVHNNLIVDFVKPEPDICGLFYTIFYFTVLSKHTNMFLFIVFFSVTNIHIHTHIDRIAPHKMCVCYFLLSFESSLHVYAYLVQHNTTRSHVF